MIKDFLTHIWPSEGLYCIAVPQKTTDGKGSYYKHNTFSKIEDAVACAKSVDEANLDCYMAVGTLKEEKVWNEKKGKHQVRIHENIAEFKSLIFDIDCGEGKPYPSHKEALSALKKFIQDTGLPYPTVINSGGGLHVYFTFDKSVPAEVWHKFSLRLAGLAKHFKLDVDTSRTCDKSSVLRVAGTHNHKQKDNPRSVEIIKWGKPTPISDMKARFTAAINYVEKSGGTIEIQKHKEKKPPTGLQAIFGDVDGNVDDQEQKPASSKLVYSKCNFMKQTLACGGAGLSEPEWRAGLSIDRLGDVPDPHAISCEHSDYSYQGTEDKVSGLAEEDTQPYKCDTIRKLGSMGWCDGCPHEVKSPIVLGRPKKPAPLPDTSAIAKAVEEANAAEGRKEAESKPPVAPTQPIENEETLLEEDLSDELKSLDMGADDEDEVSPDDYEDTEEVLWLENEWGRKIAAPNAPEPYKRSKKGGITVVVETDEGAIDEERIYQYDIFPWKVMEDDTGIFSVGLKVRLPHPKPGEEDGKPFVLTFKSVANQRTFSELMAEVGILPYPARNVDLLYGYMKKYINTIQEVSKPVISHSQLGWDKERERFILPNKTINLDGGYEESSVAEGIKGATDTFYKKGTLEEWKDVINTYTRPGYEGHAFGHCVGYGSLLLHFTGFDGGIVNIVGGSGSGKTTVAKTVNSIFGHYKDSMLVHHDTYNAKMNRFGVFNSVCVTYDEITNIQGEEVSDLCYAITQGRGKHRLNQNAEEKQNHTHWKLLVLSTGNDSLINKLSTFKQDSSAEMMRVFEFRIDPKTIMNKEEAGEIFDHRLTKNFGHAGEPFIEYVIKNQEEVNKLIKALMLKFDKAADIQIPERYWSAIVSCSLAGGYISNKLGLTKFDMDGIFDWCLEQVHLMRGTVEEANMTPVALIVEFLNSHWNNTIVMLGGDSVNNKMYRDTNFDVRGTLLIRHESDTGLIYVDAKAINDWLKTRGADFSYVKKSLSEDGILLSLDSKKILTQGSDMPSTGQTRCWVIDKKNYKMSGQVNKPVESVEDTETTKIYGLGKGVDK